MNQELINRKLSVPLKNFIRETYRSQKNAAKHFKVSQPFLTMVIQGKRKPTSWMYNQLELAGFDVDNFVITHNIDIPDEIDTAEDFRFIVSQLKAVIRHQEMIIRSKEMVTRNHEMLISDLREKLKN